MSTLEKTGFYGSILIIFILLFLMVFSKNGIIDYWAFKNKETVIADLNQKVAQDNKKLENEINSLKTDKNYIKHLAKHEHGMAEEGELIFKNKQEKKVKINE